jgi:hypothetical protein
MGADLEENDEMLGCPLLVLTDQQKIFQLVDEKDMLYGAEKSWDLSGHSLINELV